MKYTFHGKVWIEANYNTNDEQLILTVQDTGVGIKEDRLKSLFTVFS